jgi:hypothetical protein
LKAELVACEEEKATLDEERATSAKPAKKKRSIFGTLPSDDDDLSGTDGEHPSKLQVILISILFLKLIIICPRRPKSSYASIIRTWKLMRSPRSRFVSKLY